MEQKGLQAGLGIVQDGKCYFLEMTDSEKNIVVSLVTEILNREAVTTKLVGIALPEDMQELIEGIVKDC